MDEMNYTEFNAEPNTEKAPRYSEAIVSRAPLMAKWLMTMFWANIAHIIINFIKIESSVVYTTIQNILIAICSLVICHTHSFCHRSPNSLSRPPTMHLWAWNS